MFLSSWVFGLRLPAQESVGCGVMLGLGANMRTSGRPHADEYSLGSEILCYSSGLDLELPQPELWPEPQFVNQDPSSHVLWQKQKKDNNHKE